MAKKFKEGIPELDMLMVYNQLVQRLTTGALFGLEKPDENQFSAQRIFGVTGIEGDEIWIADNDYPRIKYAMELWAHEVQLFMHNVKFGKASYPENPEQVDGDALALDDYGFRELFKEAANHLI